MNDTVLLNISIESEASNIWKILVNEKEFNQCFHHLKIKCNDWKVGETIEFISLNKEIEIVDKAIIRTISENTQLSYGYVKENESNTIEVSFTLKPIGNFTYLTIEGKHFKDELERSHSENAWIDMMQVLKKYVQKK